MRYTGMSTFKVMLLIIYCIVTFIPNELEAVKLERNWRTKPLDETHVSINVSQPGLPFYQILNKIGEDVYTGDSDSGDILYGGSRARNTFNKYSVQADLSTGNPIKFELDTVTTGDGFIKEPTFVGRPFEYTHDDGNEYVFLFYREVALEYTAGPKVNSRIARVCKNDTGDNTGTHKFVTFIKASLECSVPNGDEPAFQYNYMQDVVWDQSSQTVYAVFTLQENRPPTSALCSYRMQDIMNLFDNGYFTQQNDWGGINSLWNEVATQLKPRPGTCHEVHTTDYPPLLHKSVPSYNAMERTGGTQVAPPANFPTSDPPIFNVDDVRFTSLAVDFDNSIYYIGTRCPAVSEPTVIHMCVDADRLNSPIPQAAITAFNNNRKVKFARAEHVYCFTTHDGLNSVICLVTDKGWILLIRKIIFIVSANPVISVPSIANPIVATGGFAAEVSWTEITATDVEEGPILSGINCTDLVSAISVGVRGGVFGLGSHNVTCEVTDSDGCSASETLSFFVKEGIHISYVNTAPEKPKLDTCQDITDLNAFLRCVAKIASNIVITVNNILQVDQAIFDRIDENSSPSRIVQALESYTTALQLTSDANFTETQSSVAVLALTLPRGSKPSGFWFATLRDHDAPDVLTDNDTVICHEQDESLETESSIFLPAETVQAETMGETVNISVFVYQNSKLFRSPTLRTNESPGEFRRSVGSRIIAATVEGVKIENPPSPIITELQPSNVNSESETADGYECRSKCVYWDFSLNNGFGDWSAKGCKREMDSKGRAVCICDHLTNFAVIVDIYGRSSVALDVISKMICGVSIVAVITTVVTYLSFKKFRSKQPQQILLSLCFALLGLYVFFLAGIEASPCGVSCGFVAVLIHYFTLAAMLWMAVEAINLYLMLVKVMNANVAHFMIKASCASWGLPLLVVITILAADYTQYSDNKHCFLKPGSAFYVGLLLPIGLVLLFNFVIFALIMRKLTCQATSVSSQSTRQQTVRRLQNAVAISVLLGLTWIFGLLSAIRASTFAFQVLFAIFNSAQGLLIFLLFCARQKEVREAWLPILRRIPVRLYRRSNTYNFPLAKRTTKFTTSSDIPNTPGDNIVLSKISTRSSCIATDSGNSFSGEISREEN
ncbi:adhesion G protein-coupled receptor E1-like [Patiria miniata]|uniref:Uncharacterized protein n=1 Tax=Patiria miniata TaxID=46514 RepID=A0A914BNB2_PATMI|nr:adhesion G protein-coupled receptor E1-like [Patiria miniata]